MGSSMFEILAKAVLPQTQQLWDTFNAKEFGKTNPNTWGMYTGAGGADHGYSLDTSLTHRGQDVMKKADDFAVLGLGTAKGSAAKSSGLCPSGMMCPKWA